ncbi:MAG: phosphotransferase family protein, partial [Frankia sp.]
GRARAEIYQAVAFARLGRIDEAHIALRHAVVELESADVYPTLILCAARALEILGLDRRDVDPAADRARRALQPIRSADDLDARIDAYVSELLGDAWRPDDLFREATTRADAASGFYNHNIRIDPPAGPVIVRIPIPASDAMDLTIWPESAVLRALRGHVRHAPRLLYAQDGPRYQVHDYIAGDLLEEIAPRGVAVPGHVIDDVLGLFDELGRVPRDQFPALPARWPDDGDTAGFARRLSAVTIDVHRRFSPEFGSLFATLGIPADPFASIDAGWAGLHSRPFRLLHTDIHRKNMILAGSETYFLDWELALYGDPVYDLAVHLHKMAYQPDEIDRLLAGWPRTATGPAADHWRADLAVYLAHERVKSAIVDTVRYTKLIAQGNLDEQRRGELVVKLVGKLNAAYDVWNVDRVAEPSGVSAAVRRWR